MHMSTRWKERRAKICAMIWKLKIVDAERRQYIVMWQKAVKRDWFIAILHLLTEQHSGISNEYYLHLTSIWNGLIWLELRLVQAHAFVRDRICWWACLYRLQLIQGEWFAFICVESVLFFVSPVRPFCSFHLHKYTSSVRRTYSK